MTITRYCPSCGTERKEGERFCRNCGAALGTGSTKLHRSPEAPTASEPTGQFAPAAAGHAGLPPPPASVPAPASIGAPAPMSAPAPVTAAAPVGRAVSQLPFKPLPLAGGLAIVVAVFLPWLGESSNALDVPIEALWNLAAVDGPVKLGFALLALGGLGAGLSFVSKWAWLRRLCGSVALAVTLGFALQTYRAVDQFGGFRDVLDAIGFAVYIALAGAVALQVSR
ncbi:MAG: zinc-ribbon domain-containing protein [Actinomycetota bacterium]